VVSYATSPPAEIVFAEGTPPTRPSTSVPTDGCYRQIEYAGVLAGAQNPQGARLLIDWLLSTPVQEDIPLNMFVFPARSDAALPQVFTDFAAQVEDPEQIPAQEIAGNLDDWLARWGEILGR
jgi:thiamine transport system substrate-binding protein